MDAYKPVTDLLSHWEALAAKSHPADAMLLNKQIRELREALAVVVSEMLPPEGFVLVPVEPTEAMLDAANDAHMPFGDMGFAIAAAIAARPEVE